MERPKKEAKMTIYYYAVYQGEKILGIYSDKDEAIESAKRQSDDELVSVEELDPNVDIMNLQDTYSGKVIWCSDCSV